MKKILKIGLSIIWAILIMEGFIGLVIYATNHLMVLYVILGIFGVAMTVLMATLIYEKIFN